jgi:hypothetical protein
MESRRERGKLRWPRVRRGKGGCERRKGERETLRNSVGGEGQRETFSSLQREKGERGEEGAGKGKRTRERPLRRGRLPAAGATVQKGILFRVSVRRRRIPQRRRRRWRRCSAATGGSVFCPLLPARPRVLFQQAREASRGGSVRFGGRRGREGRRSAWSLLPASYFYLSLLRPRPAESRLYASEKELEKAFLFFFSSLPADFLRIVAASDSGSSFSSSDLGSGVVVWSVSGL